MTTRKTLIAYYSRAGQNYVDGNIVDLQIGNTEVAAKMIQKRTDGDLFRIETVQDYPADYHETTEVAARELEENARPDISDHVDNMADYEVVCLGYPNWWGTMPMAVLTFLDAHDLSGKTILPFCTHEGSGIGRSEGDIHNACPGSRVIKGLAIKGGSVRKAEDRIAAWLEQTGQT